MANEEMYDILVRHGLTHRQAQICVLICTRGLSYEEIGTELFITRTTVRYHLNEVFVKLGVNSMPKLMIECKRIVASSGCLD